MIFTLELLDTEQYSYLKDSEFYESLDISQKKYKLPSLDFEEEEEDEDEDEDEEDIEELSCPYICSKNTENIILFLDTINFWGVRNKPPEFYELLFKIKPLEKLEEIIESTKDKYYKFLYLCCKLDKKDLYEGLAEVAAVEGYLDVLKFTKLHNEYIWDGNSAFYAGINNHLECLKYLAFNGCRIPQGIENITKNKEIKDFLIYYEKNKLNIIFSRISKNDMDFMGFNSTPSKPKDFLLEGMMVDPPKQREYFTDKYDEAVNKMISLAKISGDGDGSSNVSSISSKIFVGRKNK